MPFRRSSVFASLLAAALIPATSHAAPVKCSQAGWCRIGLDSAGNAWSVKIYNSLGSLRAAFINNGQVPWAFDCYGYNDKRIRYPGNAQFTPVIPGTITETIYDYVCGR